MKQIVVLVDEDNHPRVSLGQINIQGSKYYILLTGPACSPATKRGVLFTPVVIDGKAELTCVDPGKRSLAQQPCLLFPDETSAKTAAEFLGCLGYDAEITLRFKMDQSAFYAKLVEEKIPYQLSSDVFRAATAAPSTKGLFLRVGMKVTYTVSRLTWGMETIMQ